MGHLLRFRYLSQMKSYSLNMHAQLSSGARSLNFGLRLHLCLYIVCESSEGSGKTEQAPCYSKTCVKRPL